MSRKHCHVSCLFAQVSARLCPDRGDRVHRHLREEIALRPENLGAHGRLGRVDQVWPERARRGNMFPYTEV